MAIPYPDYYPDQPYRRFFCLRDWLEVAERVTQQPGGPGEIHDYELFARIAEQVAEAGEQLCDDDEGAKGFIIGTESPLRVRAVWSVGSTDNTRAALEEWGIAEGYELLFDEPFEGQAC